MQYQVQEMLRLERIFEPELIQAELDVYNPLIPDGSNWKATLMFEYPDAEERREALAGLVGVETATYMQVGDLPRVTPFANEDLDRTTADKTSAVHFLRFELTPTWSPRSRPARRSASGSTIRTTWRRSWFRRRRACRWRPTSVSGRSPLFDVIFRGAAELDLAASLPDDADVLARCHRPAPEMALCQRFAAGSMLNVEAGNQGAKPCSTTSAITVADFARSKAFYEAALRPLGLSVVMAVTAEETGGEAYAGFRPPPGSRSSGSGPGAKPKGGTHVAFAADTRAEVDAFYHAALAAGGRDNGAPGPEAALPRQLLRRLRPRSRRQQHRGGLPQAGMSAAL